MAVSVGAFGETRDNLMGRTLEVESRVTPQLQLVHCEDRMPSVGTEMQSPEESQIAMGSLPSTPVTCWLDSFCTPMGCEPNPLPSLSPPRAEHQLSCLRDSGNRSGGLIAFTY